MIVTIVTLFGLGCMKMETEMIVHPNGSATGSVIIAIEEMYWNMSKEMNTSMGDFEFIDTENATIWREDGWVYIKSDEMGISEENMSVEVKQYPGYTEYKIEANLSEYQEEGEVEDYNLSDPFTQIMLQSMTFKFTVVMPGTIVDSNAHQWSDSTAIWSYTGASIQEAESIYVKSKAGIPETLMLPLIGIPVALLLHILQRRSRSN